MPELPEVETIRLGLLPRLVGQTVNAAKSNWKKSFQASPKLLREHLIGSKIIDIERRGKVLIIKLSDDYSLLIHLKMTGQLVLDTVEGSRKSADGRRKKYKRFAGGHPTKSMVNKLPDSSTRVIFDFKSGDKLFFNDQRKF